MSLTVVARLAAARPRLVELAEEVSLAARVDPPLLRGARLDLRLPIEAEADLWFSPLVATRGPEGFVFAVQVLSELRARLVGRGGLAGARARVEVLHRALPHALRLEEEVVWRALAEDDPSALDLALQPAARAILDPSRKGLELWARRLLDVLPDRALDTRSARVLGQEVALRAARVPAGGPEDWTRRVEATGGVAHLAVRLVGRRLELGELPSSEGAITLAAAESRPNLLELRDGSGRTRLVAWSPSQLRAVEGVTLPIQLRFVDGSRYEVAALGTRGWFEQLARWGTSLPELSELLVRSGHLEAPTLDVERLRAAVLRFQADRHLGADGLPGPRTLAALRAAPPTRRAVLVHTPDTLAWARYLEEGLARAGTSARTAEPRLPFEADDGEQVLCLVSPPFLLSKDARRILRALGDPGDPGFAPSALLLFPNVLWDADRPAVARLPSTGPSRDELVGLVGDLGLRVDPAGPPPALPPHLRPEDEDPAFGAIAEGLRRGVFRAPDVGGQLAESLVWASFLAGRTPENAWTAVASALAAATGQASPWRRRAAALGPNAWERQALRVPGRDPEGVMPEAEILDPEVVDRLDHREPTGEREPLFPLGLPVEDGAPLVLDLAPSLASTPVELTRGGVTMRAHPGLALDRPPGALEEAWHVALGVRREESFLGPAARLVTESTAPTLQLPEVAPRILVVEVSSLVLGSPELDRLLTMIRGFPRDGLLLVRVVVERYRADTTRRMAWLLGTLHALARDKGPDAVLLRLVTPDDRAAVERELFAHLRRGAALGEALAAVHRARPAGWSPWFVWSDPLFRVEVPMRVEARPSPAGEHRSKDWYVLDLTGGRVSASGIQCDLAKEWYRDFFGAQEDRRVRVTLTEVRPDGARSASEHRRLFGVKSRNYRVELGAFAGKVYPHGPAKPIVVFHRLAPDEFEYALLMPRDAGFAELSALLGGPSRRARRRVVTTDEVRAAWPASPLLS